MPEIVRPSSLTVLVVEKIQDAIIEGRIEPGAMLSEKQMAAELGTSKTPVREAFVALQSIGLIDVLPQRGGVVFRADEKIVRELCEVRLDFEIIALRHALERHKIMLAERMSSIVDQMTMSYDTNNPGPYLVLDHEFHSSIMECCDNAMMVQAYRLFSPRIRALRTQLSRPRSHVLECSLGEHIAIRDKVRAGDADGAMTILRTHINRVEVFQLKELREMAASTSSRRKESAKNAN